MIKHIILIIASAISGYLCYQGGESKRGDFLDILRHKWVKWAGCSTVALLIVLLMKGKAPWIIHALSLAITYWAMTTYWDNVFGKDNFFAHGAGIGAAHLPYAIYGTITWPGYIIRIIFLALFMGIWSAIFKSVKMEAGGRGAAIVASLKLYTML